MDYQINRFVINVPMESEKTGTDQLEMDFFLQREHRKVILGTVRFPDGTPAPCAVIKFFRLKHSSLDAETTSELEPTGHAIADDCGQFLLGPVYPGDKIILKIFYINGTNIDLDNDPVKCTREPEI